MTKYLYNIVTTVNHDHDHHMHMYSLISSFHPNYIVTVIQGPIINFLEELAYVRKRRNKNKKR